MNLSNYPPGVSGNEPQIVGYPECPECDEPYDADPDEFGGLDCPNCGHVIAAGFDPDERYDRAREERFS